MAAALPGLTQALGAMENISILTLFLAVSNAPAESFDYSRYVDSSLDSLIERALAFDIHESGQSVLTPTKPVHLHAPLLSLPKPCPDELPILLLRTTGASESPSMRWCMQVKSESGQPINMWVQDSVAPFIKEEYQLGDRIELWAIWLFVNATDRKPYFVVNSIGPAIETSASDVGGT